MNIFLNNKPTEVPEGCTITAMLNLLQLTAGNGTALAINSDVVARTNWDNTVLQHNDKIIIIKATQGG
jgi:sulfur carrier protein